jgi:hypothetical protein
MVSLRVYHSSCHTRVSLGELPKDTLGTTSISRYENYPGDTICLATPGLDLGLLT